MIKLARIFILLLLWPAFAQAAPVVADLSNYRIDMDSSFNGTRMFLFGVRNDPGDLVVAIRGPQKNYVVRKKEAYGGIWVNRDHMEFYNVPDFYALASSKPLAGIEEHSLFTRLGIGQENLLTPPTNPKQLKRYPDFAEAFLRHQHERRLYVKDTQPLQFMGETLFKTTIEFPDNIPPGSYTAEIYLLSDGEVVGMQSTPIEVVKTGLDAFLYNYAHLHPILYGLGAVLMALGIGYFAGRILQRT